MKHGRIWPFFLHPESLQEEFLYKQISFLSSEEKYKFIIYK